MSSTSVFEGARPNIFELLARIRERPSMYLGHDDGEHVRERMMVLGAMLSGYGHALDQLGFDDVNTNFARDLGQFIQPKLGYGNEIGPVFAALKHNPEKPLEQFWQFVDEFRAARGL
ncbi:MAG: hypothetical protein ABUL60_24505 [Myxococcales bacterium]